jgi:hypothetical protein
MALCEGALVRSEVKSQKGKWPVQFIALAILVLVVPARGTAQDSLACGTIHDFTPTTEWNGRKIAATSIVGGLFVMSTVDAYFTWWKDTEKSFTFYTDAGWPWRPEASHRGIDKPGHFFGTYSVFKMARNILLWGGYSKKEAFWWAAGYGFFNGLQIEVGDGFSAWGFDPKDFLVDVLGVSYGMLQCEVPFFENINFKCSYWSATGFKTPIQFTKDYDAMTIWASFNMHNLLPGSVGESWPSWLNLAVGYGVDDHETRQEFVLGIDINFEGIATSREDVLLVERLGNLWRPPAPAIKWIPGREPLWYALHKR